jgi:hypothetical protein
MPSPVDLDNEAEFFGVEIKDVRPDGMLAPKFDSRDLARPEEPRERILRIRGVTSKVSGAGDKALFGREVIRLVCHVCPIQISRWLAAFPLTLTLSPRCGNKAQVRQPPPKR